jgi:Uma2 family endonuclease
VATTTTKLTTFAEFEKLPEAAGFRQELRHGELIQVAPPKHKHFVVQRRLRQMLSHAAGEGIVDTELGFRPLAEGEYRIADVAYVSKDRWREIDPDGNLHGAPELVIEVLSPSNTVAEILDKESICLENGSREFWVVDLEHRQVKVSTPDGHTITYRAAQEIPLFFSSSATIAAAAIFE